MDNINIENCSSCGKNHEDLEISYLGVPVRCNGIDHHYFTFCPTTEEPIYVRYNGCD